MAKYIRRVLLILTAPPAAFMLYVAAVFAHAGLTDFQPADVIPATNEGPALSTLLQDSTITCLTWNIGYAGLGAETAFFYEQGRQLHSGDMDVITPLHLVQKNQSGIAAFLQDHPVDFCLLQEVDQRSKRSHYTNQFEAFSQVLPQMEAHFATNYDVKRIPVPNLEPFNVYGKVLSGLATYSAYHSSSSNRLQLPGEYPWKDRIFQLDRCLLVNRIPFGNGELVLINLHHSAYDQGGYIKAQQMAFLRELMRKEYSQGHHVIAGGDWNQCPPGFTPDQLAVGVTTENEYLKINADFLPTEWSWTFDATTPSHRETQTRYIPDSTFVSVIDFYLTSPNVEVVDHQTVDADFRYADHQPVLASFKLK